MHHVSIRVGTIPAGEGVRAETGVNEGDGCLNVGICQVRIVFFDLFGKEHPLVDDCLMGKAGRIVELTTLQIRMDDRIVGPATDKKELALEHHIVLELRISPYEDLANERFR